jgi:predicted transcriptional regulator
MEESKRNTGQKKKVNYISCENCEAEKQAVVWCENCSPGTYYCQECDTSVHSGKATRSHVRMSINDKKKRPHFSKCENHLEENKFYCSNCKIFICNVCVVDNHSRHNTMSVFKYAENIKKNLKSSLSIFAEIINILQDKETKNSRDIKNLEQEKTKLLRKYEEADEEIKRKTGEREKDIQQRKNLETSQIVLKNSIDEMGVEELINKDSIELMKNRIKKISEELCPKEVKQVQRNFEPFDERIDYSLEWPYLSQGRGRSFYTNI